MGRLAGHFHPPSELWQELVITAARLVDVLARGWRVAGEQVLEDLTYSTRRLERELETLRGQLPRTLRLPSVLSVSDLVADLAALEAEFDDVELDIHERTISAITGPIELEGMYLGRFRITLHWETIGGGQAYQVEATEPYAAEGTDDVTHPHVRDGQLCEGEGTAPIKSALSQGRLLDFFMLVRQILETYNPASAHVALDRWDGVNCRDCGSRMSRDEHGRCEWCEDPLCSDCSHCCESCDRYTCSGCSAECAACGSYFCTNCLTTGVGAGRLLCRNCLESEQENENDIEPNSEPDDSAARPTGQSDAVYDTAPLHALCLGKAAVSA
jgi:hypothetical protein